MSFTQEDAERIEYPLVRLQPHKFAKIDGVAIAGTMLLARREPPYAMLTLP
jgi:hypothetical protein